MTDAAGKLIEPTTDPLAGIEAEEYDALCRVEGLSEDKRNFILTWMRTRDPITSYKAAGWYETGNVEKDIKYAKSRLNDPEIKQIVDILHLQRLNRLSISRETIEGELAKIAFHNVSRFYHVQEDGTVYLDFSKPDQYDMAAVSEISCDISTRQVDGDRREVFKQRVKFYDKLRALETLAKIRKMIGGEDALDAITDIAEAIRAGRKRAGLDKA